jgi:thioredoxin-related protein
MSFVDLSVIILWLVVIVQSIIIYYLSKYVVDFLNSFKISNNKAASIQLLVGQKAPLFREEDQNKMVVKLSDSRDKNTILLFVSNDCMFCKELLPKLYLIPQQLDLRIIVISQSKLDTNNLDFTHISILQSELLFRSYFVKTVPEMFLLDSLGYIVIKEQINTFHGMSIILGNYLNKKINYELNAV